MNIPAPKAWLPTINPGFGPDQSLGINFISNNVLPFVIGGAIFLIIFLALIFLIFGGIMWITSGGNKEGVAKAKNTITYALIGLAVGISAFLILNILSGVLNFQLIR